LGTIRGMFAKSLARAGALILLATGVAAFGHDFHAGDIHIGHPYATPSLPGATSGVAYFATLENAGTRPDRLLRGSTPVAEHVELHEMNLDANGVMRMREADAIGVGPKQVIKMRPGMGMHLMLIGLRRPLKDGDTFPMTMEFERAGKVELKVVVQVPKPRADGAAEHAH